MASIAATTSPCHVPMLRMFGGHKSSVVTISPPLPIYGSCRGPAGSTFFRKSIMKMLDVLASRILASDELIQVARHGARLPGRRFPALGGRRSVWTGLLALFQNLELGDSRRGSRFQNRKKIAGQCILSPAFNKLQVSIHNHPCTVSHLHLHSSISGASIAMSGFARSVCNQL